MVEGQRDRASTELEVANATHAREMAGVVNENKALKAENARLEMELTKEINQVKWLQGHSIAFCTTQMQEVDHWEEMARLPMRLIAECDKGNWVQRGDWFFESD